MFYVSILLIVFFDQLIKQIVHHYMLLGQSFPVLGNVLRITYVRNTGAAFSLFTGFSTYLIAVGIVIVVAVLYFHFHTSRSDRFMQTGLSFIVGGSVGNLIDRIFRSYVVDYIDLSIWPVFNLADIMINLGVLLILIDIFRSNKNASCAR